MSKHRFTLKELKELSDEQIIRKILYERFSDLSPYSPLGERLVKIYDRLNNAEIVDKS